VNCSRIKSMNRFNDKESSLFAKESIKSTNKSYLLCWRLNITLYIFLLQSLSIVIHSISLFKQISSCLVIYLLKSISKNFKIVSLRSLMLIHWNHEQNYQVLHHSFMKMTNHLLKQWYFLCSTKSERLEV